MQKLVASKMYWKKCEIFEQKLRLQILRTVSSKTKKKMDFSSIKNEQLVNLLDADSKTLDKMDEPYKKFLIERYCLKLISKELDNAEEVISGLILLTDTKKKKVLETISEVLLQVTQSDPQKQKITLDGLKTGWCFINENIYCALEDEPKISKKLSKEEKNPAIKFFPVSETDWGIVTSHNVKKWAKIDDFYGKMCEVYGETIESCYESIPLTERHQVYFWENADSIGFLDARKASNNIRFVRRSCKPNAEYRLYCKKSHPNLIFVGIFALEDLNENKEITLPILYPMSDSKSNVECACGSSDCKINSFYQKRKNAAQLLIQQLGVPPKKTEKKQIKEIEIDSSNEEEIKETKIEAKPEPIEVQEMQVVVETEELPKKRKNSGSQESPKRRKREELTMYSPEIPPATNTLNREERKIQALMRSFERLENIGGKKKKKKEDDDNQPMIQHSVPKQQTPTPKYVKSDIAPHSQENSNLSPGFQEVKKKKRGPKPKNQNLVDGQPFENGNNNNYKFEKIPKELKQKRPKKKKPNQKPKQLKKVVEEPQMIYYAKKLWIKEIQKEELQKKVEEQQQIRSKLNFFTKKKFLKEYQIEEEKERIEREKEMELKKQKELEELSKLPPKENGEEIKSELKTEEKIEEKLEEKKDQDDKKDEKMDEKEDDEDEKMEEKVEDEKEDEISSSNERVENRDMKIDEAEKSNDENEEEIVKKDDSEKSNDEESEEKPEEKR